MPSFYKADGGRQLERGGIGMPLTQTFTGREEPRVKAALRMARLCTVKTLASFDASFQPSLDRDCVLSLRTSGLLAPLIVNGAINGETVLADVEQFLVLVLAPGDTVVLDLSSQKAAGVQ